jgi:hypothetical protein
MTDSKIYPVGGITLGSGAPVDGAYQTQPNDGQLYVRSDNSNLYCRLGGVWANLSASSSGVSSFNTRTGAVTLSTADVAAVITQLSSSNLTVGGTSTAPTITLPNVGPGATGPIGDATHVSTVTIDANGRVTALSSTGIALPHTAITDFTTAVQGIISAGAGITDTSGVIAIDTTHANTFTAVQTATALAATLSGTTGRFVGVLTAAPGSGTYLTGDFGIDDVAKQIWVCTAGGSPGTWSSFGAGGGGGGTLYTASPTAGVTTAPGAEVFGSFSTPWTLAVTATSANKVHLVVSATIKASSNTVHYIGIKRGSTLIFSSGAIFADDGTFYTTTAINFVDSSPGTNPTYEVVASPESNVTLTLDNTVRTTPTPTAGGVSAFAATVY